MHFGFGIQHSFFTCSSTIALVLVVRSQAFSIACSSLPVVWSGNESPERHYGPLHAVIDTIS
uniref:Secreted protein n=1 Tax=Oryza brachyantha TaxID=4533 RepID=J3M8N6_ORYBR